MRMKAYVVPLAMAAALSAALLGGCGCSRGADQAEPQQAQDQTQQEAQDQTQQEAQDQTQQEAEKPVVFGDDPEAPDATAQTDATDGQQDGAAPEEQQQVERREQLSREFMRTWGTNTLVDPDDDTQVGMIEDWFDRTLSFVRPDSQLYADFLKRDQWEGPGVVDAATIVKDVQVTGHEGDTYTVVATMAGIQSGQSGWSDQTYEVTHQITFDAEDWVIALDQWG